MAAIMYLLKLSIYGKKVWKLRKFNARIYQRKVEEMDFKIGKMASSTYYDATSHNHTY